MAGKILYHQAFSSIIFCISKSFFFKNIVIHQFYNANKIFFFIDHLIKFDIVNIGWHIYLKDITAYAASPRDW